MSEPGKESGRFLGWLLAAILLLHLVLLRDTSSLTAAIMLVLVAGAIGRWRGIFLPAWAGRFLLAGGIVAAVMIQPRTHPALFVGELVGMLGCLILLRPVTPFGGLRVIFCTLVLLASIILRPYPGIGPVFIVLDVVVLMILTEQIHRPPEAALSIWVSLLRSLRVVVPVGIVVTLVFWLFPNLSASPSHAFTGFAGDDVMDPGNVAQLSQSPRVALVARFPESQEIPGAADLYWRGQVLEKNDGLRWARDPGRQLRPKSLRRVETPVGATLWKYSQQYEPNLGGILAVLERAVSVEARRGGQDVAVFDLGASVLTSVGVGSLNLQIVSTAERVADEPVPEVAGGSLFVPDKIGQSTPLQILAEGMVSPQRSTAENLAAVGRYFHESGFRYTMRPDRMDSGELEYFLTKLRRGFCEHYAAAAANLLRLGGVPARVVTGYRGGEWNPWLRSIVVRDSDAHAWVEAWDARTGCWLRFDPTNYVAPELTTRLERDLNSAAWPWHRLFFSYVSAELSSFGDHIDSLLAKLGSWEAWENLPPILFAGYVLIATGWLIRRMRRRGTDDLTAIRVLRDLERRAIRFQRARFPGETPLAWLARLRRGSSKDAEIENLRNFAECYEATVYRDTQEDPELFSTLRASAQALGKTWATDPIDLPEEVPHHPG